jgi:Na+-transporting NADH:ubiquinone oxidoreductase subunit NqrE
MRNALVLLIILAFLLGSCTMIAGDLSHWPASLIAIGVIVVMKIANDRFRVVGWPMEFLLASAVTMIVINLTRLYFLPLP